MTIMPVGMRTLAGLLAGAAVCLTAGAAVAQEDAVSAAQRPVVHAPTVVAPVRPTVDTLPKWSEFPVPPSDVPTVAEFAQRVNSQTKASAQLKTEVSALTWDKEKPEPYADATLSRLNPIYIKRLDATLSRQEIEALAAELRRRAAPPPPAD